MRAPVVACTVVLAEACTQGPVEDSTPDRAAAFTPVQVVACTLGRAADSMLDQVEGCTQVQAAGCTQVRPRIPIATTGHRAKRFWSTSKRTGMMTLPKRFVPSGECLAIRVIDFDGNRPLTFLVGLRCDSIA